MEDILITFHISLYGSVFECMNDGHCNEHGKCNSDSRCDCDDSWDGLPDCSGIYDFKPNNMKGIFSMFFYVLDSQ